MNFSVPAADRVKWKESENRDKNLELVRELKRQCHSNSSEIPSGKTDMKNSQGVNNNDNNKAKIDNTEQNRKCRLCDARDETVNHIMSECSKLSQKKYKTKHEWVGKVVHWELCKRLKFYNTF